MRDKISGQFLMCSLFLAAMIVLSAGISGCGTTGISGSLSGQSGSKGDSRIKIDNPFLYSNIKFVELRSTLAGDLLVAHVSMLSTHNSTLALQYKFRWYDVDGLEVAPDAAPWQPLILYGGESKGLQAVAPNASVKGFKIEIRYTK